MEIPSTVWGEVLCVGQAAAKEAPIDALWWPVPGEVVHTFTHFRLELAVMRAIVPVDAELTIWAKAERCHWVHRRDLDAAALPSVMRKVVAHALKEK